MKKRPRDPAQLAKLIVDIATGEVEDRTPPPTQAQEFARRGGLKGVVGQFELVLGLFSQLSLFELERFA